MILSSYPPIATPTPTSSIFKFHETAFIDWLPV